MTETAIAQPRAAVFLAVPAYQGVIVEALPSLIMASQRASHVRLRVQECSLLAHNFNKLWCECLNSREEDGHTHFAMHHADQGAEAGWIDVLLDELERTGADLISVVLPLKDERGLTSTALYNADTCHLARLSMTQLFELPETFGIEDVPYANGRELLVNSGLWVCRLDRPWVESFPGFAVLDAVKRNDQGKLVAHVFSEDWNASRWWTQNGVKVLATRKVKVNHIGKKIFPNSSVWGECAEDNE